MARNYQTQRTLPAGSPEPLLLETSISKTRLKSVVARVSRRRQPGGWTYRVGGAAWGGSVAIDRIEVRVDKGPWRATRIEHRGGRYAWLLWSYDWPEVTAGRHTLTSRAIDVQGKVQPTPNELRQEILSVRENNAQWTRAIDIT